ncbi:methyl-accepting chemotaxis protein [Aeromonas allosaccharophila]|uniref:methyl-accepting chemotaxis protein n=1 Tax=Aeromonas allosaccharophila TaxID=656 RepID=UPI0011170680|nr:methyl-accepting chemotaxis protein [Aeromonas allosaccharophila]MCE9848246.1 methyl-accepting chemotaxis protein [Aeromonas allosaccharophila]TNI86762.1 chemotaxis protein [Aeromonas allosaccharophila]
MKNLSLKQKLQLSVVSALLSVIFLLSWQSYSRQKELLLQGSLEQVQQLGTLHAEHISQWLGMHRDVIHTLASKVSNKSFEVLHLSQHAGGFQLTFLGEENGKMNYSDSSVVNENYDPRTREWYQKAMSTGGRVTTNPYMDLAYNIMVITLAEPTQGGVVGGDLSIASLVDGVTRMKLPANGFAIMKHKDGTVIAYKDVAKAMKPTHEIDNDLTNDLIEQSKTQNRLIPAYFDNEGRDKLFWAVDIPDTDWELVLVLDKTTLEAPLSSLLITQFVLAIVVLVISVLAISWQVSSLLGPLVRVSQALMVAADKGDLTQRVKIETRDEVGLLGNSFNHFFGGLHPLIDSIRGLASELSIEAERSLVTNQATVEKLMHQQQEVTMVATAVTEMASATMEIAGNAENTAAAAQQSAQSSEQGKMLVNKTRQSINGLAEEVGQATEVIGELSRHAQAITSILSTIQGIAEQTNLLALNAAIEAARAGEQGRGFAVVADEVRVLSRRTQDSTQQIQSTIETLQQTTARAVSLMQTSQGLADNSVQDADQAVRALEEITSAISLISDMAGQIATAAEEQTQVTGEITQNTTAIKDVSDEITAAAMRDLDQAQSLKGRATDLNQQVSTFIL